jgi:hypothetical protein
MEKRAEINACCKIMKVQNMLIRAQKDLHAAGFEPAPPEGDCDLNAAP